MQNLIEYLDREGRLDAPLDLLADGTARRALVSAGALREEAGRIAFVHQSHLDFLVARRVYRETLDRGQSPLDWLRNHDQSLFRRRQLHLLLQLLRDGDPRRYAETLRKLLTTGDVRFHLKHLVFSLLRQAQTPTEAEIGMVLELLEDPEMRHSLIDRSLAGSAGWFDALDQHGWITKSLASQQEDVITDAIEMFQRAHSNRAQRIEALLSPFLESEDPIWRERMRRSLPRLAKDDTGALFEWRLAEVGRDRDFAWSQAQHQFRWLATENPKRAIRLLGALLDQAAHEIEGGMEPTLLSSLQNELDRDHAPRGGGSKDEFEAACAEEAARAWEELVPRLRGWDDRERRLRNSRHSSSAETLQFDTGCYRAWSSAQSISAALSRLTSAAGRQLAAEEGPRFTKRLNRLNAQRAKASWLTRLIAASLLGGSDELADWSLRWLLRDPERFTLGSADHSTRNEQPARTLIERFGGVCSEGVFKQVEKALLRHKVEYEKKTVKEVLELLKRPDFQEKSGNCVDPLVYENGLPRNRYGWGQYYLLSALPEARLASYTRSVLRTWQSKFGPISEAGSRIQTS